MRKILSDRALQLFVLGLMLLVAMCPCALGQDVVATTVKVKDSLPVKDTLLATQDSNSTPQTKGKSSTTSKQDDPSIAKPEKKKRGSFVFAPIPILSPTFGSGLVLGLGYVFKLNMDDKLSPPSTIGLAGAFTSSGSRGGGLGARLYFSENKYQTAFLILKGRANFDFYPIGHIPGRAPAVVALKAGGTVFFGEFMRNVGKSIFIGPRFQYRRLFANLDGPQTPGGFVIPEIDIKSTSAALGIHVQRDKRDNSFYPKKGSLLDVTADFFDQAFGSRREYQYYKISYNGYHEVSEKQVLAYRGMACSANGSVPFYDLCLYGTNSDLRGYTSGQFQNRRMFATQAEYRLELPKRFGVVAFGGLGGVERNWNRFRSDSLLPAAGVGLRFKLDKKNHINYRVDLAVGREGHTLSISVGEAF